jgi:CheY-like chemotaxis protein
VAAPRILIVDDDPSIRALLAEIVRREGATPIVAASGVEGYAALTASQAPIALILLDLSMPEMDGFKFRELQLEDPDLAQVPVVVLTGHGLTSRELAFMRPQAVLIKPAPLVDIRQAIRSALHAPAVRSRGT